MKILRDPAVAEPAGGIDLDALLPVPQPIAPTPAPAPAPPPAPPAPTPTPTPTPPATPPKLELPSGYDEIQKDFARLTGEIPTAPVAPEVDPNAAPEPPAAGSPPDEQFKTNKELRTAYDTRKKELAEAKAKIAEYEAKMASAGTPVDVTPLNTKIKELETQNAELGKRLAFVNYEQSPEFEQKYEGPLKAHMQQIMQDLGELTVTDPQRGEIPATVDHFFALVQSNLKDAARLAQEMFGPAAPLLMNHRNQLVQLQRAKKQAVEHFRQNQTEIQQKQAAEQQIAQQRQREAWEKINGEIESKLPEVFKLDPNDKVKSERLQRGLSHWDALHNPKAPLTPEQRMRVASAIRYKSAGFDVVFPMYKAALDRIKALETQVAEYDGSNPPAAGGVKPASGDQGGGSAVDPNDVEAHMRLMAEGVSLDEIMRRTGRK